MSVLARPLTYDDLRQMPNDGLRYEIIDGALIVSPVPTLRHQEVCGNVLEMLGRFVWPERLGKVFPGPIDVVFGRHDVVEPDIVYVSSMRRTILTRRAIEGVPDLIVETLSPLSRARDTGTKAELYAKHGVPEYWIADPDAQRLTILVLIGRRYEVVPQAGEVVRSRILLGLEINIPALFEDLLPEI